jgi:hypothetical protein
MKINLKGATIKVLKKLHQYLASKSILYSHWHAKPISSKVHKASLLVFILLVALTSAYFLVPREPEKSQAAVTPSPNFPKTGTFYPDVSTSARIAEVAKLDYVVLTYGQDSAISSLKSLNPDIIILSGYNASREVAISSLTTWNLPPQWLLTQVGSTLSSNIDATTQTIPVNSLTQNGVTLFAVGQYLLIDGELCTITAVNTTSSTLTVNRATAYKAISHTAGVRVAPAISTYPNCITMDMTDQSPLGNAGSGQRNTSCLPTNRGHQR